jgi:hypothetical protein
MPLPFRQPSCGLRSRFELKAPEMLLVPKLHLGTPVVLEAELPLLLGLLKTKCNFVHKHRSQVQLGLCLASVFPDTSPVF